MSGLSPIILLRDVLQQMQEGKPFSITFCTADRGRGTGGEIITLEGVVQCGVDYPNSGRLVKLPNGHIRRMHIRLILRFNGKKVIW